jgi:hypothetical protein
MSFINKVELKYALKKIVESDIKTSLSKPNTKYVYHGSGVDDPLDILVNGLIARNDREGISVTTDPKRAKFWGNLKSHSAYIFQIPTNKLKTFIPENAAPADPKFDFTTDKMIPPTLLKVKEGGKWVPIIDVWGDQLSEEELDAWKEDWNSDVDNFGYKF